MVIFRDDGNNNHSNFTINVTPDFVMTSTKRYVSDVSEPLPILKSSYSNAIDSYSGVNYVTLPLSQKIPSASTTGLRGDGTFYDDEDLWTFNMFRLSETSQPGASNTSMVGFVHNEDHYRQPQPVSGSCCFKSIGVRYSQDLGKSWTRSVPIITKGIQNEPGKCTAEGGTGDMAAMWNPDKKQWVVLAQEAGGPLTMSISTDPLAAPGSWSRIDPVSSKTAPGFKGDGTPHGDLSSIPGSNPSIIRDQKNGVWHMVYAKWGGGIAYSKSSDLSRWDKPVMLYEGDGHIVNPRYPTLVGDEGDTLATDGTATLYFTSDAKVNFGRGLWYINLTF